jgi:ketosteroid isomerase-like protein
MRARAAVMKYVMTAALIFLPSVVIADDQAAVEKWNRSFEEGVNKRDAKAIADLYAQNAIVLPDKAPLFQGRDKVEAYWAEGVKVVSDLKLKTVSVTSLGPDTVQDVGTMTFKLTLPGKQPIEGTGKYLTILRKEGDSLKAIADTWNDDK